MGLFGYRQRKSHRAAGCVEDICRRQIRHDTCRDCGALTCNRSLAIDPKTLRRRLVHLCNKNECSVRHRRDGAQYKLAQRRTRKDWHNVTDPVDGSHLTLHRLPEQRPGPTRATLRAFYDSDAVSAVVDDITAESLNQALATLGLSSEMYAETRGRQTVLRRVEQRGEVAK